MDTAKIAYGYNRTLMAVPGRVTDFASAGPNILIRRQEAQIVLSGKDIIREMGWENSRKDDLIAQEKPVPVELSRDEAGLLGCFRTCDPVGVEELSELSGLGISELSPLLLELEMDGLVRQLPGNRYMKLARKG